MLPRELNKLLMCENEEDRGRKEKYVRKLPVKHVDPACNRFWTALDGAADLRGMGHGVQPACKVDRRSKPASVF